MRSSPTDAPVLWMRATSARRVLAAHLRHLAGTFEADGWRLHPGASIPEPPIAGALAVIDDPWIEALPAAARALAGIATPKSFRQGEEVWRVPRLRAAQGPQAWVPRKGPYTLSEVRARAIDMRDLRLDDAPGLCIGFAVAAAGTAPGLLAFGWPPPPEKVRLVPGVRLYRYDDPADHERREIDPFVPAHARLVVDVGCGNGRLGERLRRPGRRVIGIEPDLGMAFHAARRLDLVLASGAEKALPALGIPVDCLIFADVLEHLADPEEALSLAARSLSPEGRIVVSLPNSAWAPVLHDLAAGRWEPTLAGVQARDHLTPFTLPSFLRRAEEAGLKLEAKVPLSAPLPRRLRLWAWLIARSAGGNPRHLAAPQWIVSLVRR